MSVCLPCHLCVCVSVRMRSLRNAEYFGQSVWANLWRKWSPLGRCSDLPWTPPTLPPCLPCRLAHQPCEGYLASQKVTDNHPAPSQASAKQNRHCKCGVALICSCVIFQQKDGLKRVYSGDKRMQLWMDVWGDCGAVTESQSSLYLFLLDFAKTRTCRMLLLKVLHCGITTEGFPSTRITLLLHDTSVIGWDDGLVERERERERERGLDSEGWWGWQPVRVPSCPPA